MKLFLSFLLIVITVVFFSYNIKLSGDYSIAVKDVLKILDKDEHTIYSFQNSEDEKEIIELKLEKNVEVIVLTGEKSNFVKDENNNEVTVRIDRPNKDIILVLNSKDSITWNIESSQKTNINLVVYDGLGSEIISKNKIFKYQTALELPLGIQEKSFVSFFRNLNKLLSIQKIAYFYSEKTLSKKIIINETIDDSRLNLAYHSIANIDKNLNFSLVDKKDNFINFDLYGPKKENERLSVFNQNVVSSPDKSKLYKVAKNGLEIIDRNAKTKLLKPILIFPELKDIKGIAYDNLSDMVYLANKNGKFFLFDAITEQWHSIRKYIDDYSINSLSYDYLSNIFISSNWKEDGLIFFDQKGNFDRRYDLKGKLKGIEYHYSKNSKMPSLHIVPRGEDIAIVLVDKIVKKIWYFNTLERKAYLTYNLY